MEQVRDERRNLIMISLDTMRADVAYSSRLPFLSKLFREGTIFANTVASAPLTPASHASVFTGLYPYQHGIRHLFKERLATDLPVLAELFRHEGYQTGAVVSCPGLNKWYGFNAGFASYDDEIPRMADGSDPLQSIDVRIRGLALKRAPMVVERGLNWLRKRNRNAPFFLFLHFFDTHWPYEAPPSSAPAGRNAYEGEALFVDLNLEYLFSEMNGLCDPANTDIVIFGDHGEDLGGWYPNDHGGVKGFPEEDGHGCLLFDATLLVPLFFRAPSVPSNRCRTTQVRLIDVLPTIVELFSLRDVGSRQGRSLVPIFAAEGEHRIAYSETFYREEQSSSSQGIPGLMPWRSWRIDNKWKIIQDLGSNQMVAYDLHSDPEEKRPLRFGGDDNQIFHDLLPNVPTP